MRRSLVILLFVGVALIEALPMAMELQSVEESEQVNPEETGDFFDGDMVLPPVITMRNGLAMLTRRWPNGVVPYEIQDQFSPIELATIQVAMAEFHYYTCVRFVPRSNQTDYVSIGSSPTGCWSTVGRAGGKQVVNLQAPRCIMKTGTVMHELNHALGFLHEQNRSDRDDYVLIQYENILPKWLRNFKKYNNTQSFGMPYDYGSIMHYSSKAFSANGGDTMVPTVGRSVHIRIFFITKLIISSLTHTAILGRSSHGPKEKINSFGYRKSESDVQLR